MSHNYDPAAIAEATERCQLMQNLTHLLTRCRSHGTIPFIQTDVWFPIRRPSVAIACQDLDVCPRSICNTTLFKWLVRLIDAADADGLLRNEESRSYTRIFRVIHVVQRPYHVTTQLREGAQLLCYLNCPGGIRIEIRRQRQTSVGCGLVPSTVKELR